MDILPMNFKIFKLFGLWSEVSPGYSDRWMFLRRVLAVGPVFHFTITQAIELILNGGEVESLTEQLFLATTFLSMSCKIINFSVRRAEISSLLSCFEDDLLKFENLAEEKILKNCRTRCRKIFLTMMCLSQVTCLALLVKPFLVARDDMAPLLPFKTYQLYDTSSTIPYVASYVIQASSVIASVFLNVSCDTLVYGFILEASAQLDILSLRLTELLLGRSSGKRVAGAKDAPTEARPSLGSCVEHHVLIRNVVGQIETIFAGVISILFASSLNTLCTTVYQMSKQDLPSVQFFALQLYLSCMLVQTFFYCFYGNELQSKSRTIGDTVYKNDWIECSPKEIKSLKFVILMSQRELNVSCNGIFILSLSTFMWIIKTSYSAFNLLEQISN